MIEEALANYGVLGLWTLSLLVERFQNQKTLKKIISNNTEALTKVHEIIQKCRKK